VLLSSGLLVILASALVRVREAVGSAPDTAEPPVAGREVAG
jgi:hypothetical protein